MNFLGFRGLALNPKTLEAVSPEPLNPKPLEAENALSSSHSDATSCHLPGKHVQYALQLIRTSLHISCVKHGGSWRRSRNGGRGTPPAEMMQPHASISITVKADASLQEKWLNLATLRFGFLSGAFASPATFQKDESLCELCGREVPTTEHLLWSCLAFEDSIPRKPFDSLQRRLAWPMGR